MLAMDQNYVFVLSNMNKNLDLISCVNLFANCMQGKTPQMNKTRLQGILSF